MPYNTVSIPFIDDQEFFDKWLKKEERRSSIERNIPNFKYDHIARYIMRHAFSQAFDIAFRVGYTEGVEDQAWDVKKAMRL